MTAMADLSRPLGMPRFGERVHRDRHWLIPLASIAALQLLLWWTMWGAGVASAPLFASYNWIAFFGLSIVGVPLFLRHLYRLHRSCEPRPLRRLGIDLRANAQRFLAVLIAVQVLALSSSSFSALKVAMPVVAPFRLDPALTDLERWMFGTDPWRASHAWFGWATPLIDRIYLLWLPTMIIALYAVLLSRPSALKTRAIVTYALAWPLLGTIGAYMLSSAGPIFQERMFGGGGDLVTALRARGADGTLFAYEKLWASYSDGAPLIGGGISALPSMHIALATWIALVVRSAHPRFAWLGWAYVATIWFGSVHLGWHYVVDGAVGIAGTFVIWHFSGKLLMRHRIWDLGPLSGARTFDASGASTRD